jgi:hypothetical protein
MSGSPKDWKSFSLGEMLTDAEIQRAINIWQDGGPRVARRLCDEVVRPALVEINRKTGQENDPMYLAYMLEYVFEQQSRRSLS